MGGLAPVHDQSTKGGNMLEMHMKTGGKTGGTKRGKMGSRKNHR
jgi:hypothetical protein